MSPNNDITDSSQSDGEPAEESGESKLSDIPRRSVLSSAIFLGSSSAMTELLSRQAKAGENPSANKRDAVPPGADGDNSILLDNDVYEIDVGETESGFWIWSVDTEDLQTTTLYHEFFALQEGDGDVVFSYNPTEIVEKFPDTGSPGEQYSCTLRYEVGNTELLVKRTIQIDNADPTFTLKYDIRNTGSEPIGPLNLYQHADFDNGESDFTDDIGYYQSSPEYIYTSDEGSYSGFAADQPSINHHVGAYPAYDELRNANLNNNDQFPQTGGADPVNILQWELNSLDPGQTDSLTIQFGAAPSKEELGEKVESPKQIETEPPGEASVDLNITDVRLVQTLEHTRYDESTTYDTYDKFEAAAADQFFGNPDALVANKSTAVVFDLTGDPDNERLPEEVTFTIRLGDEEGSVSFDRDTVVVPATREGETLLGRANTFGGESDIPTFEIDPDADGYSIPGSDFEEEPDTVSVSTENTDTLIEAETEVQQDVNDMPELNVGFVGIQGDNARFGELSEDKYDEFVEDAAKSFQAQYPTDQVNVFKADLSKRYVSGNYYGFNLTYTDNTNGSAAQSIITDGLNDTSSFFRSDDDSFLDSYAIINGEKKSDEADRDDISEADFVVGVVANNYFDEVWNKPGRTGVHYAGADGLDIQPQVAGLVEIQSPSTAPHEAGHHFHGPSYYGSSVAQDNGNDTAHADANLRSTKYNLSTDEFDSLSSAPSYMSYGADKWMDTLAYNDLLGDEFEPTPPEGIADKIEASFSVNGIVTEDGITLQGLRQTQYQQEVDESSTEVTATVYGADATVLEENNLARGVKPNAESQSEFPEDENVIFGTVPFPDEATHIEIKAPVPDGEEKVSETVTPYADILRQALLGVPEENISNNGYTQNMKNRLDTLSKHVQNGRLKPAVNVLESIDQTVQNHVEEGYDSEAHNIFSKATIREMVSFRIERLQSLTDDSSQNNGNDSKGDGNSGKSNNKGNNGGKGNNGQNK